MKRNARSRAGPRPGVRLLPGLLLAGLGAGAPSAAQSPESGAPALAVVLEVRGAIGPASSDYVSRGLERAAELGAAVVILLMDTPGGLDASMRDIIRDILASPVPVATFVHPSGSRAASAGTYILYASHIAAMAPGTTLGAATPIAIGLPTGRPEEEQEPAPDEERDEDRRTRQRPLSAAEAKAVNDAVAYIRALAELRGRNADWAEQAVREAASLASTPAHALNVIDILATGLDDLLGQMDGRTVTVADTAVILATTDLAVERIDPDWRTRLLAAITNPNVALLLMMIGIYGLLFEFMNPGALYPGTIGAIALLFGLYALAVLPVNLVGALLILLGIGLMTAEAFAPSFGILGIGGAVALLLGLTILIDTDLPEFSVARPVIAAVVVGSLAFSLLIIPLAWRAHRRRVVSGREDLLGVRGVVLDWNGEKGYVMVRGERWSAGSPHALATGDPVRVVALEGLKLTVEPDSGSRTTEGRP